MTLVDAGPLIAILDRNDANHSRCVEVLPQLRAPLVTTWPAFTEAMYLLGEYAGRKAQEALWKLAMRNDLEIVATEGPMLKRASDLMGKYRDLPMDLADATLVALAEAHKTNRVFTLDDDFKVYKVHGRKPFETIPS